MGWTETFGTGKCCILWWLSCVAGVDRGGEGNGGKKREGMGERRKGLPLPFPFRAFLPSPPLPSLFLHLPRRVYGDMLPVQAMKKYDIVVRDFWIRSLSEQSFWLKHVQFKHFLGSTGKVSSLISQIFLHKHMDPGERKLTVLRVRCLVYIVLVGNTSP